MYQNYLCSNSKLLLESLDSVTSLVLELINNGCKDVKRLISYTDYYVSITLKSFCQYYKDYLNANGEISTAEFHTIYNENFIKAQEKHAIDKSYFNFNNYKTMEPDEQIIIIALLSLSQLYYNKNIEELTIFLKKYVSKLKNKLKELDDSFAFLSLKNCDDDDYEDKFALFNYLMKQE